MTTFSPRTSYASEYEHIGGVRDCEIIPTDANGKASEQPFGGKCVEAAIAQSAYTASPSDLGANVRAATFYLWMTSADHPEPRSGWRFRAQDPIEGWTIHSVRKLPHGPKYECLCSIIGETGAKDDAL